MEFSQLINANPYLKQKIIDFWVKSGTFQHLKGEPFALQFLIVEIDEKIKSLSENDIEYLSNNQLFDMQRTFKTNYLYFNKLNCFA